MTRDEWLAEVERRIRISEGCEAIRYYDTMGIPTIGIGFNLEREDAQAALAKCGVNDLKGVIAGTVALTESQIDFLFDYSFAPIEAHARASLPPGTYDFLSDARRFVICDLVFNLGFEGWMQFTGTRGLIADAQHAKDNGRLVDAHVLFGEAADHLKASAWYGQVGNRAKRDCAMLRSSLWANADGDGSDVS